MQPFVAVVLVGVPLAWLAGFAAYVYLDAPNYGMNRRKWAVIAFVVPLFGFFAYLFERDEQGYDPSEDPYAGGGQGSEAGFAVHESRRGEASLGPAGTGGDDGDGGDSDDNDDSDDSDRTDEWNDPDGIDV